jgi:hypothetical protein
MSYLLQESTIKPLVVLLNIARLHREKETLNNEINDNVSDRTIQVRHLYFLSSSKSGLLN